MRRYRIPRPLFAAVLLALLMPGSALAYLDPGTGSFIVQMLIGVVLGGLVAIGVFWRRFAAFVRRLFGKKPDDGTPGSGSGGDDQSKTD